MLTTAFLFIAVPTVSALLGVILAGNKGRSRLGWGLGALLFPFFALLILLALPNLREDRRPRKPCPECGEMVLTVAKSCHHCGQRLAAATARLENSPASSEPAAAFLAEREALPYDAMGEQVSRRQDLSSSIQLTPDKTPIGPRPVSFRPRVVESPAGSAPRRTAAGE